ncbi:MarR family winged helix-turn-helix transcriptional regulator [Kineococcus sp. SYSU DK006]|uniref:MarR family winged helix-turn-helix transcriptional regulator n=1 Tax=Kineococcus sp. SYSU DK006 TaxID=3383127 RepID=UPI003D7E562F
MTSLGAERPDPTERSSLQPLFGLLAAMDEQIAAVYAQHGVQGVRPRFSKALIRLHRHGPTTIKELAAHLGVTHSAMSQTVTAMRRDGLLDSAPGADARTRTVSLSQAGRALVPFLEAEWRATEAAWADLEAEVPYPLQRVVADLRDALARRSFADRVSHHLDQELAPPPAPGREPRRRRPERPAAHREP